MVDLTVYQTFDRLGYGQIGLAGSGGAGCENQIVAIHGANVLALRPRAGRNGAPADNDARLFFAVLQRSSLSIARRHSQCRIDIGRAAGVAPLQPGVETVEHGSRRTHGRVRPIDRQFVPTRVDRYIELLFDTRQMTMVRAEELQYQAVVVEMFVQRTSCRRLVGIHTSAGIGVAQPRFSRTSVPARLFAADATIRATTMLPLSASGA